MDKGNWLTIVGLGEDGPEGLPLPSRRALEAAEVVMAPPRHLALVADTSAEQVAWPVPFADGVSKLLTFRGRQTVVLVSGDPFWFGAGSVIARHLDPSEWQAVPGPSVFSWAAARLGWPLETVLCRGLHAAPFARIRCELAPGLRIIATLRDGAAVTAFAHWLTQAGFGASRLVVMEALGGPRERVRDVPAKDFALADVSHPVTVAVEVDGIGEVFHRSSGQSDEVFSHDGQITKRPVRALTLSALAPRPGERLWDVGAGSGSVALEWLMADPSLHAVAVEQRSDRVKRIHENAAAMGQDRLEIVEGTAPDILAGLQTPDAVFVGGGLTTGTLDWLESHLATGTRLVANAVTLETQALVTDAALRLGGDLLKFEFSEARPIGRYRGWKAGYSLVQWTVTL